MAVTKYGYHETLTNRIETLLNGSITNASTSIVVDDATGLPTKGFFRIKIDSEIILCSGRSSNTLAAFTRGAEGTTAASHSDNAPVSVLLTAGGLQQYLLDHVGHGFGSNGYPLNRVQSEANATLTSSNFTWNNQGSASITDDPGGGFTLTMPSEANHNLRGMLRSNPSTPFHVITRMRFGTGYSAPGGTSAHAGLFFRQSSSGKLVTLSCRFGSETALWRWTNETTFSAGVDTNGGFNNDAIWLRLTDDGTDIRGAFSHDGNNWTINATTWWRESRTAFLLTTGPSHYGFYANSGSSSTNFAVTFDTFLVEQF